MFQISIFFAICFKIRSFLLHVSAKFSLFLLYVSIAIHGELIILSDTHILYVFWFSAY